MLAAFMSRDEAYDGIFIAGVTTTGIYCRSSCSARKPNPENVEFFLSATEAVRNGFRPCLRCRPDELGRTTPDWVRPLLNAIEEDPVRRWRDADLESFGLSPTRVRRWFKAHRGTTFHRYSRARRLASAKSTMDAGTAVTTAAFDAGWDSLSGFNEAFKGFFGSTPTGAARRQVVTVTCIPTPLGPLIAAASDQAIHLVEFVDRIRLDKQIRRIEDGLDAHFIPGSSLLLARLEVEIGEYFSGERRDFTVPIHPVGTEFQRRVWSALREISYGDTATYAQVARAIGSPNAARGVGRANGDNALAILIPCHRVIGSNGKLTGYGAGVWRKERLLEIETVSGS